jgi:hypothetical protein
VEGLVMKVEQHYPLLMGDITEVSGRTATIGLGARDGLASRSHFIVVHTPDGERDVRAGRVCRAENRFVELVTRRVDEQSGLADILPPSAGGAVKEGDYVYAR